MTEMQPRVYDPVSTSEHAGDEKPPSYFDVVSQIRAAKIESKTPVDLAKRTVSIILSSFISTIVLAISSILPIIMLVIGLYHKENCLIQPRIPLWLIVMGICGLVNALIRFLTNMIACARFRKTGQNSEPKLLSCFAFLLSIFLIIWFIIGNVWVYGIYNVVQYDRLFPNTYCSKTCYLFSFWSITASWILLALSCLCICGTVCMVVGVAGLCTFGAKK